MNLLVIHLKVLILLLPERNEEGLRMVQQLDLELAWNHVNWIVEGYGNGYWIDVSSLYVVVVRG